MISGISKLYIQLHSNIFTHGFSCGGKRLGFLLKQSISWVEIPVQRNSAIESGEVEDMANTFTLKCVTVGLLSSLSGFNGKRVVCRYITSSGEDCIIGIDQPLAVAIGYSSGTVLGDDSGMVIKISSVGRFIPEILQSMAIPSATCFLRADSVIKNGYDVVKLVDKTGNSYDGICSDTVGVLYKENMLNGKPVLHVDKTSIHIDNFYIGNTSLWGGGINSKGLVDEYTIVIVVKFIDFFEHSINLLHNSNLNIGVTDTLNALYCTFRGSGGNINIPNFDKYILISLRFPLNNNVAEVIVNGELSLIDAGTNPELLNRLIYLGVTNASNQFYFAELRIWDKILNKFQLDVINDEIMQYYGL